MIAFLTPRSSSRAVSRQASILVGGNGLTLHPGPFANAYPTRDLPISWFASYLYAGIQVTAADFGAEAVRDRRRIGDPSVSGMARV